MRQLIALAVIFISYTCHAADTRFGTLVLMQPDFVLQQRGLDAKEVASFAKSAQATAAKAWKKPTLPSSSGCLVLAV